MNIISAIVAITILAVAVAIIINIFLMIWTERSGAAPRCLPSAPGSASAASNVKKHDLFYQAENGQQLPIGEAEAEPGADSSSVRLPVSDSESVECRYVIGLGEFCGKPATHKVRARYGKYWLTVCQEHRQHFWRDDNEIVKLSGAPQRSGGEQRKPNAKVSHPAPNRDQQ